MKKNKRIVGGILLIVLFWTINGRANVPDAGSVGGDSLQVAVMEQLDVPSPGQIQVLITEDGSRTVGRILAVRDNAVSFETDLGILIIPVVKIREVQTPPTSAIRKGHVWHPNPNETRLFFAPNGRTLRQGEGYFADYYILFPGMAFGLTDRLTIGGGMSLIPGIRPDEQLFYVTPKLGVVAQEHVNLAVGALFVRIPDEHSVGILYGVSTFGTPDASLTVGMGFGFEGGDSKERPFFMVGGEKRISSSTSLVTENWLAPGMDAPLVSYGIRFFGKRLSVDLGLLNLLNDQAIFPGVPYVDFVFKF